MYEERKGKLISVEGLRCSGKSTLARNLERLFEGEGHTARLISFAETSDLVNSANEIRDSLSAGEVVVCDGYIDTCAVYGDLPWRSEHDRLCRILPLPDLTLWLDSNPESLRFQKLAYDPSMDVGTLEERKAFAARFSLLYSDPVTLRAISKISSEPSSTFVFCDAMVELQKARLIGDIA